MNEVEKILSEACDELVRLQAENTALRAKLQQVEAERDKAIADITKLATKPITPCYSCGKTCLAPTITRWDKINWCKDWQWRGAEGRGKAE